MASSFVHINGVDYELAEPHTPQTLANLMNSLKPQAVIPDRDLRDGLAPEYGGSGGPERRIEVLRDGNGATLVVRLDRVWSVATWTKAE